MPDIRSDYPFQVSWHGGQDDPMFVIRAETIEEFREGVALIAEAWASVTGQAPTEVVPAAQDAPRAPAQQVTQPPAEPIGPACEYEGCGQRMVWRTGVKDGVPWKGWFCPTRNRAHKAIWV
jgi:hypothetical protein